MRNRNNAVIYYVCFASQAKLREKIAGYLFDNCGRE
jgi:hypothetical protein